MLEELQMLREENIKDDALLVHINIVSDDPVLKAILQIESEAVAPVAAEDAPMADGLAAGERLGEDDA